MFNKIKKVYFTGMFGVLYISFIAQLVYVLGWLNQEPSTMFIALGALALEWLVLISARYLSKRSSSNGAVSQHSANFRRR